MVKVGIYARVSTKDKEQNPENQFLRLREYCEAKKWEYVEYKDYASGTKVDRPGLKELMSNLDSLDGILVIKLDRFGRSVQHLLSNLEVIRKKGKFFEAIDQGLVMSNEQDIMSNFMFTILAAVAQFERDLISERVRDGIIRKKGGNPDRKVNGRKKSLEKKGVNITEVMELRNQGKSIREISEILNIKKSSIQRYISTFSTSNVPEDVPN